MNAVTRALIALLSVSFLPGAAQAEESATCPYCATWKPLSGHRFLSAEVLIVRRDQVALPGCNAVKATLLQYQAHPRIETAEGLPPALLVYFRLDESPLCSPAISGVASGALLELQYVPTHSSGDGEVELRVLHAHEIPGTDRTSSSAQWFAVRSHEN